MRLPHVESPWKIARTPRIGRRAEIFFSPEVPQQRPRYAGRVPLVPDPWASSFLGYIRFSGSLNHAASLLFS